MIFLVIVFMNKKGVELAVNTIVMLIIGIVLFGLGMSLFANFISAGDERIDDLSNQVRTGLGEARCSFDGGSGWICAPSINVGLGHDSQDYVYVANRGGDNKDFEIDIRSSDYYMDNSPSGGDAFEKDDECGEIIVGGYFGPLSIAPGEVAAFPIQVLTTRVVEEGCSFVLLAEIRDADGNDEAEDESTPLIINVD